MCSIPGVAESTYKMCYRGEPTIPFIKYKTLPCMYPPSSVAANGLQQRLVTLKRATVPVPQPPKLPAPTMPRPTSGIRLSPTHKDRSKKILDTKFGPMNMETIESLYNKYRYTTFTQKAAAECVRSVEKPVAQETTLEPKADMVRLRGQRYEQSREDWQDAVLWDRLQSRFPTNARPGSPCKDKLLRRSQIGNCLPMDQYRQNKIRQLVQTDGLANVFVRKCPGYAGYNPLCPPETRLDDRKNPPEMTTLMSASYRKLPDELYDKQSFARQCPFSQTVTLTYPFNPFNKVGDEISSVEKSGLYSTTGMFMGLIG